MCVYKSIFLLKKNCFFQKSVVFDPRIRRKSVFFIWLFRRKSVYLHR